MMTTIQEWLKLAEAKFEPAVTPDAEVVIGKYGIPVNVKIEDETDDQYLFAFHDHYNGFEVYRGWYLKDDVKITSPRRIQ